MRLESSLHRRILRAIAGAWVVAIGGYCTETIAATPPDRINYQGVLRDAGGMPLTGSFDMTFRFFSASTGGDEILLDTHSAMSMMPVTVTSGLFEVRLGGGVVADGNGPGTYASLSEVFRDYGPMWMEIEVNAQILLPRVEFSSSPYALNASNLEGKPAAAFLDTSAAYQGKAGPVSFDGTADPSRSTLRVYGGTNRSFLATNTAGGGSALLSEGETGVLGRGNFGYAQGAGVFFDNSNVSSAYLAAGYDGILGYGAESGGRFRRGIWGNYTSEAALATYWHGIEAKGPALGGRFTNLNDGSVEVKLAGTETNGSTGVTASGTYYAGYFYNDPKYAGAALATEWGISSSGTLLYGAGGGSFNDTLYTGKVQLGRGDVGVVSYGNLAAGYFRHGSDSFWDVETIIANGSSGISSNGTKNFVQNHPHDASREIVYTALEGDEVGTYTRGSATLVDGVARVALGETFAWVTNPDIGLTAVATARRVAVPLAIDSVSTTEIVVRAPRGAPDVTFDYVVQGLRIGFEQASIVRPKRGDAPLPAMREHLDIYAGNPELEKFNASSRFSTMPTAPRGPQGGARPGSDALIAAIGVADKDRSVPLRRPALTEEHAARWSADHPGRSLEDLHPSSAAALAQRQALVLEDPASSLPPGPSQAEVRRGDEPQRLRYRAATLPVEEAVEPGDVLVNSWARPGTFVRGREAGDRGVIGVVAGEPGEVFTTDAPLAMAGTVVLCKVDATERPIEANDLLMASSLAGHAMAAGENPKQGTVIGKALEELTTGTGVIKVLVMMSR